jgi:hypothetical protein
MTALRRHPHLVGKPGGPVGLAALPSEHRYRYRQEFLAEL